MSVTLLPFSGGLLGIADADHVTEEDQWALGWPVQSTGCLRNILLSGGGLTEWFVMRDLIFF